MEALRRLVAVSAVALFLLLGAMPTLVRAQDGPAPAPMSDGVSIDQGIAYVLLFVALVLTYVIHPLDAFPYNLF